MTSNPGVDASSQPSAVADHVYATRVYFEDTDAGGIVYYANYLKFAERARTELLRASGIDHSRMMGDHGIMFAVRRCEADYLRPAKLDDEIEVHTTITDLRGASLWADQVIRLANAVEDLARLRLRLACMTIEGRPARIPDELLGTLKRFGKIRPTPSRQLQQRV